MSAEARVGTCERSLITNHKVERLKKVRQDKLIKRRPSKTMAQQQSSNESGRGGRGGGQSRPASRQLVDAGVNPNQFAQFVQMASAMGGNTTVQIVNNGNKVVERTRHEVVQAADICFLLDVSGSVREGIEQYLLCGCRVNDTLWVFA